MKVTADTNVLVRVLVDDDRAQREAAGCELEGAEVVAIGMVALCELTWVLRSLYKFSNQQIAEGIRRLIAGANVACEWATAEAGLAMLDAGGDFADGVIAHEGEQLGGATFLSFDRKAVKFLERQGKTAKLLS